MFEFLKNLFGYGDDGAEKQNQYTEASQIEATHNASVAESSNISPQQTTGVSYKPDLVPQLKQDHQKLLVLFGEIQKAAGRAEFNTLQARLSDFKNALNGHLLVENMHFYAYVSALYAMDEDNAATIHEFRREMGGISRVVKDFLKKYESINSLPELATFQTDLSGIGEALVKRIEREEGQLYSLYLPR